MSIDHTTKKQATRLNTELVSQSNLVNPSLRNNATLKQIVHLGMGAFHRAHQAVYTEKANLQALQAHGSKDLWKIVGVSLRSSAVREQLEPQDNYYSVTETDVNGNQYSVISVIHNVLVAPQSPSAVLAAMGSEETKIVSLTITEKGYCHDPSSGNLNIEHPDIQHDLANLLSPKTAIGFIVSSLKTRFERQQSAYTVLCCDNLPSNGNTLAKIVKQFSAQLDQKLADWIQAQVSFPNTMVDRIVPATTPEDIQELTRLSGFQDLAMVKTERFSQWVIEDDFVNGRPDWGKVGVSLVADVAPFENAKLRLLNGAHSSLAYLGYLSGYDCVHQVMQDKDLSALLSHLMHSEIIPTLTPPQDVDLPKYANDLLQRFSNPALNHRTYQIAMDGSQKLPQRLLHTIQDRLETNSPIDALCFAVAGWLRYTMGFDLKGDPIEVQDPFASELLAIQALHFYDIDKLVEGYLSYDKVFSEPLKNSEVFRHKLTYWLGIMLANGVQTAVKILLLETANQQKGQHD